MATTPEQKIVVFQVDTQKERDVTSRVGEFQKEGWKIESVSAAPLAVSNSGHIGVVVLLSKLPARRKAEVF